MKLKSTFGAFLDPVADKVILLSFCFNYKFLSVICEFNYYWNWMQLMVAATLILLCTRPLKVASLGQAPWLLVIPSIAIIGREVLRFQGFYNFKYFIRWEPSKQCDHQINSYAS